MSAALRIEPRRRGRRPGLGLTREEILAQALVLLDQVGTEGFSIRRLAEVLDVTPMALYHYVESYDDLVRGVVSLVLDKVEIPARCDPDWRVAVGKLLVSLRKQLLEHPHVLGLLASVEYWGPTLITVSNELLALLQEAGFSKGAAARAYRALIQHTFGSLLLTAADPQPDHAARIERVREHLRQMPTLNSERMGGMLSLVLPINVDLDREFAFSLDRLLAGLEGELATRPRGPNRTFGRANTPLNPPLPRGEQSLYPPLASGEQSLHPPLARGEEKGGGSTVRTASRGEKIQAVFDAEPRTTRRSMRARK
jgi:AcrR family transcriptional regulator